MRIASIVLYSKKDIFSNHFSILSLNAISTENRNGKLLLIIDKDVALPFVINNQIEIIYFPDYLFTTSLKKIWLRANLFSILKKHSIEKCFVFGETIKKFKNNINFINSDSFYQNETLKKIIKTSTVLFVQNDFLKEKLLTINKPDNQKLTTAFPGPLYPNLFLDYQKKTEIKNNYSDGKEYFLIDEDFDSTNIIMLLKAFSIFKKWQQSNMKLFIVVNNKNATILSKLISNYKHRSDVQTIENSHTKINEIRFSAYAAIFLNTKGIFSMKAMSFLENEIPIFMPTEESFKNSFEKCSLFFYNNEQSIAENLILLYKDEMLRNRLIENGKVFCVNNNWKLVAENMLSEIHDFKNR
jgi:hypothetical protein